MAGYYLRFDETKETWFVKYGDGPVSEWYTLEGAVKYLVLQKITDDTGYGSKDSTLKGN